MQHRQANQLGVPLLKILRSDGSAGGGLLGRAVTDLLLGCAVATMRILPRK